MQIKIVDTTAYLSEQPESRTLTTPKCGRVWSSRDPGSLLVEMQKRYRHFRSQSACSLWAKHNLTIQSSNHAPWRLPQGVKVRSTQKPSCNVYNSFIHNCQNLKPPRCSSISEWVSKIFKIKRDIQTMEYHSAPKIIELSSFREKIWENLRCLFLSEEENLKWPRYM